MHRLVLAEAEEIRSELAELGLPNTRETLIGYLHGFGQATQRFTAETGYFDNDPRSWTLLRPAAIVELADSLGLLDGGGRHRS